MRRSSILLAAASALLLCGCDEKEAGVGPGPGPVTREESSAIKEVRDRVAKDEKQLQVASRTGDGKTLPGGALFDGNTSQGDVDGGLVVAGGAGGQGKTQKVAYTKQTKYKLAGEPPYNGAALPKVALPDADPSGSVKGGGPVLAAFDAFQRQAYAAVIPVFSRSAWGARAPKSQAPKMNPSHVTVHHTAGHRESELKRSQRGMQNIQAFHQGERGWDDIGYHFVLDGEGRIFEGRHADVLGAHAGGANTDNIGISLMGDYDKDVVSEGQKTSLKRLISFLALRYRSDPSVAGFIQPHKHYSNTGCPGRNLLAFLDELRRGVVGETKTLLSGGKPNGASGSFVPLAVISA
jgi:hypothetical protein